MQIKFHLRTGALVTALIVCVAGMATAAFAAVGGVTLSGNVQFVKNLSITGALSKGSGTFVIDHPLDPKNKLLYHSFVESPDVKNVYDGIAKLDDSGSVSILLPTYFEALNTDFRYQLFPLEKAMPGLYVKERVKGNRFTIGGGVPRGRVSWQVTGIRHDPYIVANPVINDVLKSDETLVKKGECLFEPLCR